MEAEKKLESIQHEVQDLKHRRHQVGLQIRSFFEQHLRLLEAEEAKGEEEIPENVHRRFLETSEIAEDLEGLGRLSGGHEEMTKGQ